MGLRMATPWKHPNSGIYWMRRRVPADLVETVGRREEKLSLRTRDPSEAKAAYVKATAELEARWARLRQGTKRISHKQAIAIAGEFYRELVSAHEDDPGDAEAIGRHRRTWAHPVPASGRHSGPRWRRPTAGRLAPALSIHREGLRRCRIPGTTCGQCHIHRRRNHSAPTGQVGFAVQPRRWVVEPFFAWINRNRRLWKDAEATIASATAFLYAASAMILIRRIARPQ